jgi:signal transduction histidine kinase
MPMKIHHLLVTARDAVLSRRPALSWAVLGISLCCLAAAAVIGRSMPHGPRPVLGMPSAFAICLGACLFLALAMFTVRRSRFFRILLVPRACLIGVLLSLPGASRGLDMVLTLPLLMEIGIAEAFPLDLALCLGALSASAASGLLMLSSGSLRGPDAASGFPRPDWIVVSALFSVAVSLLLHYRERMLHMERERLRLDAAVGELAKANLGYQEYATVLEKRTMEEERKRITRDIHDIIGYTLTNNIMMMEAAVEMVKRDPPKVSELMREARRNAEEGLDGIRNALHLLRAQEDPRLDGIDMIRRLVTNFHSATGVTVRLEYGNTRDGIDQLVEGVLFHVIQEALTNSFRHGRATLVEILFWRRDDGTLVVNIRDNGGGAIDIHEGIGISGMRERVQAIGGSLRLRLSPLGVTVTVEVPPRPAAGEDAAKGLPAPGGGA